jgi:hypothetical protein
MPRKKYGNSKAKIKNGLKKDEEKVLALTIVRG